MDVSDETIEYANKKGHSLTMLESNMGKGNIIKQIKATGIKEEWFCWLDDDSIIREKDWVGHYEGVYW